MDTTTALTFLGGGLIIGVASAAMMFFHGKIAGMSGVTSGLLSPKAGDLGWRMSVILGIVAGGFVMALLRPEAFTFTVDRSLVAVGLAGLLVGFGARLGSGCTSGHGVCGVSRFAPRSLVATATFITAGALVTLVVQRVFGGAV